MIYSTLHNRTKANIQEMYSKVTAGDKSKHHEFVEVHRDGKVFLQLREVGNSGKEEIKEKDTAKENWRLITKIGKK